MSKVFGRANLDWLDSDFFKKLSVKQTGLNIAILKVFLALAADSDYQDRTVKLSYTSLETITGLSRPMISQALGALKNEGLITVSNSGRGKINTYRINDSKNKGWSKIPYRSINRELKNLSNRSPNVLGALKIFLVLLRHRNNALEATFISHEKLRNQTCLQNSKLAMCRDILINHNLIEVGRILEDTGIIKKNPNFHIIAGLNLMKDEKIPSQSDISRMFNS